MAEPCEISDVTEATTRLVTLFRAGGETGIDPHDVPRYAQMLAVLASSVSFEPALGAASARIWQGYNHVSVREQPNRFTRAISRVGTEFGFAGGDLHVLTAAATPTAFGELLGNRQLWKDSFALGHGEFAHSYQWLAVGGAKEWGAATAQLYQRTKGRLTVVPCWVKDDAPELRLRAARLWEYLVDCTLWQEKLQPRLDVARGWVEDNVRNLCRPKPRPRSTNPWLEKLLTGAITVNQLPNILAIPGEEIEAVRNSLANVAETKRFADDNAELMEAIAEMLVTQFPFWNALATRDNYRNANNVTTLARQDRPNDTWFVTVYEKRREAKLYQSQNLALIDGIKELIGSRGMVRHDHCLLRLATAQGETVIRFEGQRAFSVFLATLVALQKKALDSADAAAKIIQAFRTFLQSGTRPITAEEARKPLPQQDRKAPKVYPNVGAPTPVSAAQAKGPLARVIPSPMDALAQGRQRHYGNESKQGQGWTSSDGGVFHLQDILIRNVPPSGKTQLGATFHGIEGTINEFSRL